MLHLKVLCAMPGFVPRSSTAAHCPCVWSQGGGGNPFGGMGNLMENLKKAQQMVQVEAAKVQEELAK
jgi:hypothetical protein